MKIYNSFESLRLVSTLIYNGMGEERRRRGGEGGKGGREGKEGEEGRGKIMKRKYAGADVIHTRERKWFWICQCKLHW